MLLLLVMQDQNEIEFWIFSINVQHTVDESGRREPSRFQVKYYATLEIKGDHVTGRLRGVEDVNNPLSADSFGQADIEGHVKNNRIQFDLKYTGEAAGDIERIAAVIADKQMVGTIESVKSMPGHRGYEGAVEGLRMAP